MPDYDLHSFLGWRSFEQLVQALAVKVFGAATIIFGDGPDGGREATYNDRTSYPTAERPWDGYIVIQAKFRQRPATDDVKWALDQLAQELENFAARNRVFPKYYIFATNVVLPPRKGGAKDKAFARVTRALTQLKIIDYAIWDYDQIRTFLDVFTDVRQTYTAWTTPGDVLGAFVERMGFTTPGFDRVISNFLEKQLLADQYANLETAGYKAEERILLNRVFVDLPIAEEMVVSPPSEAAGQASFLATLLEAGDERLDPASHRRANAGRNPSPPPGRFVLLGGPGQGKSTAGQYVSQIYRAALLRARPNGAASVEASRLIEEITAEGEQQVPSPKVRRFPIRVVLSEFADYLGDKNHGAKPTLLAYIASLIDEASSSPILPDDMRLWLGKYPWLLVLDGLDEVPVSANRQAVLQKIREFWVDAGGENADILVVATCRPQSYNADFLPQFYKHLWLVPLTPQRALDYAARLVGTRFRSEVARISQIMSSMQRAASEETTARLMRTPLQVTIMAVLIDQGGEPPHERWKLFRLYYSVMYSRETQKPMASADILRNYQPDIDAIHHRTALVLQILAERTGNTEAQLPASVFGEIVERRLAEEDHRGPELTKLRDSIVAAACERLVFLVGLKEGRIGFEIRSLQEYMAAEALMDGTQAAVTARLQQVATVSSWRNAFLFAAGSCFAVTERQHLRPTIYMIAGELNEDANDPVARVARAGALLATDLIEDASARHQPGSVRAIARIALRMLELPPGQDHVRLARLHAEATDEVYREHVLRAVTSPRLAERKSGWLVLLELAADGVPWGVEESRRLWPAELAKQLEVVSAIGMDQPVTLGRCQRLLPSLPLHYALLEAFLDDRGRTPFDYERQSMAVPVRGLTGESLFEFRMTPVTQTGDIKQLMEKLIRLEGGWRFPSLILRFLQNPRTATLADTLDAMASGLGSEDARIVLDLAPWPLAACFAAARGLPAEMGKIAERVRRGDYGTIYQWLKAEQYWKNHGLGIEKLIASDRDVPFGVHTPYGFPCGAAKAVQFSQPHPTTVALLAEALQGAKSAVMHRCLSEILAHWTAVAIDAPVNQTVLTGALRAHPDLIGIAARGLHDTERVDTAWLAAWDSIGMIATPDALGDWSKKSLRALQTALREKPSRRGLLQIAMYLALRNTETSILPTSDTPKTDRKAILIRELLQDDASGRPSEIAEKLNEFRDEPELSLRLIDVLASRVPRLVRLIAEFVATSHKGVPSDVVLRTLRDDLHSRSSGFAEARVWKHLELPATLGDLIETL